MKPLVNAPSRTEQVYHAIRESICDCSLEPGMHLVQEDLAGTLGVSRQPVQQAMLLLKNDGLVVESGGRGLFVAPIDRESMEHHYQIRLVLDQLGEHPPQKIGVRWRLLMGLFRHEHSVRAAAAYH